MPKKSDLGHKIDVSLAAMKSLMESIDAFTDMPLKDGLTRANVPHDEKLNKSINEVIVDATSLGVKVKDLCGMIGKVKPAANSRFDTMKVAHNVVSRFLETKVE